MKVYEAVLDVLQSAGIRQYAGMVGSTTAPYVATIGQREGLHYTAIRHEQVGAAIVDAISRMGRAPACLIVHGATGTLAASLGIAAAARDGTPMVVLTCTQERIAMERGYWQTLDVLAPLSGFVKFQARVERPERAAEVVRQAVMAAVSGRPGVAQVDLPIDVSIAELDSVVTEWRFLGAATVPSSRPWPEPSQVVWAADLLEAAQRPVILVGGGAWYSSAGDSILALAEKVHAPVVSTPTSRGVVPESHPLSLGPSGIIGYEGAGEAVVEADLIVAIGSRLSDLQLARGALLPRGAPIVQVDIDPSVVGRDHIVTVGAVSDAKIFAEQLAIEIESDGAQVPGERRRWTDEVSASARSWVGGWIDTAPDNGLVQPQEVVAALIDQLPPDAILTHGAGDHAFYGFMVPVDPPGTHLMSTTLGAMGCSLGLAMGAKIQRPHQTVVACAGDGELMLQIGDLETLAREQLGVVVVVFNNFRLGSQRKRVEVYGPPLGVDHTNPDFAELAELFGCRGFRVDKPGTFAAALEQALACGGPALIDVIVDPEARPPRIEVSRRAH